MANYQKLMQEERLRREKWALNNGYDNFAEYQREQRWNNGIQSPMSENENCASYLGVHIGEILLSKIFKDIKRMPYANPGYDWICDKGYKINTKTSTLDKGLNRWMFNIDYNNITDYFMLIAFDDIENLNPMHVLLIEKNEIVRGRKFYMRSSIHINNKHKYLLPFQKYEWVDKLERLTECCKELKENI